MQQDKTKQHSLQIKKDSIARLLKTFDNKFQIVIFIGKQQVLGSGSFGSCYLGIHRSQKQQSKKHKIVVVKEVKKNRKDNTQQVLYKREVQTLTRATTMSKYNKNLVKCYPYTFSSDRNYYIVMEYCQNKSLFRLMNQRSKLGRKFNFFEVLKIFTDIMHGYSSLVKNNIIHQDLKTQNIFIKDKDFKIGDFGLSFIINKNQAAFGRGGTPAYNALQKYLDQRNITNKSDIYAIGIMLYRLFYGLHPYYQEQQFKHFKKLEIEKLRKLQRHQQSKNSNGKLVLSHIRLNKNQIVHYNKTQLFLKFYESRQLKERVPVVKDPSEDKNFAPILQKQKLNQIYKKFGQLIKRMVRKDLKQRSSYEQLQIFIMENKIQELIKNTQIFQAQKHPDIFFSDLDQRYFSQIQLDFEKLGDQVYFSEQSDIFALQASLKNSLYSSIQQSGVVKLIQSFQVQRIKGLIEYTNKYTRIFMQVKNDLTELDLGKIYKKNTQSEQNTQLQYYQQQKILLEFTMQKYLFSFLNYILNNINKSIVKLSQLQLKQYYRNDLDCLVKIIQMNLNYLESQLFICQNDFSIDQNLKDINKNIKQYLEKLQYLDSDNALLTWYYVFILKFVQDAQESAIKSFEVKDKNIQYIDLLAIEREEISCQKVSENGKKVVNMKEIQKYITSKGLNIIIVEYFE